MKKIIFALTILSSLSSFAADTRPRIIATYTDFYNDDDLVSQCLIFNDGSGMKLFDGLVPFNKPEEFKISAESFKAVNDALDEESLGGIDKKARKCNESLSPMKVLGKSDRNKWPYVTGESKNVFYNEQPACWTRQNQDHVILSATSKSAVLLKDLCGFKDQEPDL